VDKPLIEQDESAGAETTLAASADQEMQTLSQEAMMGEVRCVRDFLSSLSVLRLRPCLERIGRKAPMDEKKPCVSRADVPSDLGCWESTEPA
jgi:hypothetical protein